VLGDRLKLLRENRGMTIEELSDRLDIPADCLVDVELGKRRLSQATIREMAELFAVAEGELLAEVQPAAASAAQSRAPVTPETIGKKIRVLREQRGWSLGELSRRADLSPAHLSEVERGLSAASLKVLEKIAEVLEVPSAVLLGSEEVDALGDRMRRLRERVGLTQKELADAVGVTGALVGQIETGRMQPSVSTLTRLAHALGVSPCYFLIESEVSSARNAAGAEAEEGSGGQACTPRALEYPEVQGFLAMLDGMPEAGRPKLLGLLSWLTEWRGAVAPVPQTCHVDPLIQELTEIAAGLSPEEKSFLVQSARFAGRKSRGSSSEA
jgi:transcriptional regulator with XRE-family HTH domain